MATVRPAEVGGVPEANVRGSKVFVSYSRKDKAFVEKLVAALTSRHRQVWVDWQDIPPTAEWRTECFSAIDAAETLVDELGVVLSILDNLECEV